MSYITLQQANDLIAAIFAEGRSRGFRALSAVVVDAGGHAIAFQRQDGTSSMRLEIATGKAAGALSMGVSSRRIGEMAVERPVFIASLASVAPKGMLPAAGGVIIVDQDGRAIGAVGVTGDTSDNDELCALAGLAAVDLKAGS